MCSRASRLMDRGGFYSFRSSAVSRKVSGVVAVILAATAAASAQSITTGFTASTTTVGTYAGNFFDVTALSPGGITINSWDLNCSSTSGTALNIQVWYKVGTWFGFHADQSAWTLLGEVPATAAGAGNPTPVIAGELHIPEGQTYGIRVGTSAGSLRYYGSGTYPLQVVNDHVRIDQGAAQGNIFTTSLLNPRGWSGTIHYAPGGVVVTGGCCLPNGSCEIRSALMCNNGGGTYRGDNTDCVGANCVQPGACCFGDGTCQTLSESQCAAAAGTYNGNGSNCATANCPQPGACCMPFGCIVLAQPFCIAAGGTFVGVTSTCPATCAVPSVQVLPPANALVEGTGAITTMFNSAARTYQHTIPGADFAAAPGTTLVGFTTRTRSTTTASWPAQDVVFSNFDIFIGERAAAGALSTTFAANVAPGTEVQVRSGPMTVPAASFTSSGALPNPFGTFIVGFDTPFVIDTTKDYIITVRHTGNLVSSPSMDRVVSAGAYLGMSTTTYNGTTGSAANYTIHQFLVTPGGSVCYANCDGSTVAPVLNVDDFTCFINEFAVAQGLPHAQQVSHYANCDGSTTAPALNVDDFTCFINQYAQGCP
jgi:hypothetical protein